MRIQPAIKAAVSFGAGIFITFSQSHSPEVGLYTLAVYGLIVGLSSVALAFGRKIEGALQELPMATLATLIGIFALLAAVLSCQRPAGPSSPNHEATSYFGKPASAAVGTVGIEGCRLRAA